MMRAFSSFYNPNFASFRSLFCPMTTSLSQDGDFGYTSYIHLKTEVTMLAVRRSETVTKVQK